MSQSDLNISNVSRSLFRAENNNALQALATLSSGATEPTTTYPFQLWADTSSGLLKQRTEADDGWIAKGLLSEVDWGFLNKAGGTMTGDLTMSGASIIEAEGAIVASAATTDIWATDGNTRHISGNVTISSFGTAPQAGMWMKVIFDGALTLTNSANLNLNSNTDISIQAGDMALVYADTTTQFDVFVIRKTGVSITETPSGFKNKIIGGDFTTNPWQRGTSFAAPINDTYTADRFLYNLSGSGVVTILKTADAPTASQAGLFTQHCLHVDVTTADASLAAADLYVVQQRVEGLNAASFGFGQAGTRYVTLSFWHKHTKTGVNCVAIRNSANDRSYVAEYTQDVSDTWESASLTIPVDTSGTWLYDNGVGLRVVFPLAAGSNFQTTANSWAAGNFVVTSNQVNNLDSTANNFKIALVQLEAGSTATAFETRSVGQEQSLCERYFQQSITGETDPLTFSGNVTSAAGYSAAKSFKTVMRVGPTVTLTNASNTNFPATVGSVISGVKGITENRLASATAPAFFQSFWTANAEL